MKILRNILAVILGVGIGMVVNMFIVMKGSLPEGITINNLAGNMHLLDAKHFVFPILGHAIGTLVGALVAALVAFNNKFKFAMAVGLFFFIGGIANIIWLGFPVLPAIIDLVIAYFPMSFLGWKISRLVVKEN